MSIERPITDITSNTKSIAELKKEFKAKVAGVASRGFMIDRLSVPLPADVHGEWIPDDEVSIAGARALGFEIDKEYATKHKLHSNAAGEAKIGDAVFMTIPKYQKEVLDELAEEERVKFHGIRGAKPAEERQYANNISKETPIINESRMENKELSAMVES